MKSPSKLAQTIIDNDTEAWVEISKSGKYPRTVHSDVLNETFIIKKVENIVIKRKNQSWWSKLKEYLINR